MFDNKNIELDFNVLNATSANCPSTDQPLSAMAVIARAAHFATRLTVRETEVMYWVARGKSDWQIGQILLISGKTANYHVERAKRKLGVSTRLQAVVAATLAGLIKPAGPDADTSAA